MTDNIDGDYNLIFLVREAEEVQYAITAEAGPNGGVAPSSVQKALGDDQAFTATPDTGYEVDVWRVDGVFSQNGGDVFQLNNIQSAYTVSVSFKLIQYELNATSGENGSVSPVSITKTHGASTTFAASSDGGMKWIHGASMVPLFKREARATP